MSAKVFLKTRSRDFLQCLALPVVVEGLEALQHRVEAEVHRSHVQRGEFGGERGDRLHALFDGHVR